MIFDSMFGNALVYTRPVYRRLDHVRSGGGNGSDADDASSHLVAGACGRPGGSDSGLGSVGASRMSGSRVRAVGAAAAADDRQSWGSAGDGNSVVGAGDDILTGAGGATGRDGHGRAGGVDASDGYIVQELATLSSRLENGKVLLGKGILPERTVTRKKDFILTNVMRIDVLLV